MPAHQRAAVALDAYVETGWFEGAKDGALLASARRWRRRRRPPAGPEPPLAGHDVEPDAQPARRGTGASDGRRPGRLARANPRSRRRQTARWPPALRTVPAKPRWLLAIPDAISQLERRVVLAMIKRASRGRGACRLRRGTPGPPGG